ncbi:hypothetical protein [Dinghuibacter silviterrae]|uniref:Uncharacterized protein n=1 Tax=Dinghuibacter silviterrae TaxID=1539049 RepID=A0A4R8DMA4_9BACT|nr:hypothetical protein [Dinghuibacter silviterrae]TDW99101.1 hypothetical protein EDB95_0109 [Dinghuibacter silviterrae]
MFRRHPKIIAVLLLLALSQHVGLRLWMHHWLHEHNTASAAAPVQLQQACDCFSDTMLPLEESTVFTLTIPSQNATALGDIPSTTVPDTEKVFYSLKGPPVTPVCA